MLDQQLINLLAISEHLGKAPGLKHIRAMLAAGIESMEKEVTTKEEKDWLKEAREMLVWLDDLLNS